MQLHALGSGACEHRLGEPELFLAVLERTRIVPVQALTVSSSDITCSRHVSSSA